MSEQQWKTLALFLASLLIGFMVLIGATPLSGKLLAQITAVQQCGLEPTSWEFQALQSLVERYGAIGANACKNGEFRSNHPEVRADIADWLAISLNKVGEQIESSSASNVSKKDFDELNQLYEQTLAQVEALEKKLKSR